MFLRQWKDGGLFQSTKGIYNILKGREEEIFASLLQDNYGGACEIEICQVYNHACKMVLERLVLAALFSVLKNCVESNTCFNLIL